MKRLTVIISKGQAYRLPPCHRCNGYGGVVTATEPHYLDLDDGYGPRLVSYEPSGWDYCSCPYGQHLKRQAAKREAAEDAWMERQAASAADEALARTDCGGGW